MIFKEISSKSSPFNTKDPEDTLFTSIFEETIVLIGLSWKSNATFEKEKFGG
ncbi:hypothetical protein PSHI8_06100 [Polynucleobacter sp. SHI8]|nr:hypothetical protein PSHI2_06100 [Polynucleobacter sp. SHI2]BDW12974.1 hypothetical protein PSHI8_06100 [Polynucleobacter sp. SHI8]